MESKIFYVLLGVVLLLNILVSVYIAWRDDLEPFQRKAQIVLIWLIPFIAAIGIWLYYRIQGDTTHRKRDDVNSSGYSGVCSGGV